MVSLLVRNYSIHFHCCCCYFFFCCCSFCCFCFYLFRSLAHFMSTNTKPSETIGDTQKTMTISATSFRGCNRFSPLRISLMFVYCALHHLWILCFGCGECRLSEPTGSIIPPFPFNSKIKNKIQEFEGQRSLCFIVQMDVRMYTIPL